MKTKDKKIIQCNRRNLLMSKLVDISARIADKGYVTEAAKLCQGIGTPLDVALRVITQPSKRRKTKLKVKQ